MGMFFASKYGARTTLGLPFGDDRAGRAQLRAERNGADRERNRVRQRAGIRIAMTPSDPHH